jgi:uncharacterized protein YgfB (UPF0149 family)
VLVCRLYADVRIGDSTSSGAAAAAGNMAELPDYDDIAHCLGDSEHPVAPAEAHGTLCGLLCTAAQDLPEAWIRNTLADTMQDPAGAPVDAHRELRGLYRVSLDALSGTDMKFRPLLPADDRGLAARTTALAVWCQGFLYGLAVRGLRNFADLDGEIGEFLEDLVQISRAELEDDAAGTSEQNEASYAELVEYVRVGVQLFYETANAASDRAMPPDLH